MPKYPKIKSEKPVQDLRAEFWNASSDTLLDRKTIAAGIVRSVGWMELKALTGGGIPFLKCGRRCLYRKSDALRWLEENSKRVHSTSEYGLETKTGGGSCNRKNLMPQHCCCC